MTRLLDFLRDCKGIISLGDLRDRVGKGGNDDEVGSYSKETHNNGQRLIEVSTITLSR